MQAQPSCSMPELRSVDPSTQVADTRNTAQKLSRRHVTTVNTTRSENRTRQIGVFAVTGPEQPTEKIVLEPNRSVGGLQR